MRWHRGRRDPVARAIARVVDTERCSGCGACALLDPRVTMQPRDGFVRPVVADGPVDAGLAAGQAKMFRSMCPGVVVRAAKPAGSARHPYLGPIAGIWEAWAADPATRSQGSSGGTLTALAAWLAETGRASQVIGARASAEDPRRTVAVSITTREEAMASAGSRYAPVANAAQPGALDPTAAFIGKPCEASAVRALTDGSDSGLLLSFFCAGTPNQAATDGLVRDLGIADGMPLDDLWYRGRGWPGRFTAVPRDGEPVSTTYRESWAKVLGPTVQWRCRLCADGVGESADISAGDFWRASESGYPDFAEQEGVSVLIARTQRGLAIVREAQAAGVLVLAPVDPDEVARVQPAQVQRRRYLTGRLTGTLLTGRPVTRYRGFGLLSFTLRSPRRTWAELRGTVRRMRARRSPAPAPALVTAAQDQLP